MAFLHIVAGPLEGTRFPVSSQRAETIIGRDGTCDIVLPFGTVSRRHARLIRDDEGCQVEDLGSINGTFLNGHRLQGRAKLRHGDRINIYHIALTFDGDEPVPAGHPGADSAIADRSLPAPPDAAEPAEETCILGHVADTDPEMPSRIEQLQLRSITQINRRLGGSFDLDQVLPRVLDLLFEAFPQAATGQILLLDSRRRLIPKALKHGRDDDSTILNMRPMDQSLAAEVIRSGTVYVGQGEQSSSVLDEGPGCTVMTPVMGPSGQCRGVIGIELECDQPIDADAEVDFLEAVAAAVGQAVEHAESHVRLLAADRREQQFHHARDVQLQLLPHHRPKVAGYELASFYAAAEEVGGDCFDYLRLRDGRLIVTLGDVAGKGLPAALKMARLTGEVRHCLLGSSSVKTAMRLLNRECFLRDLGFITFIFCLVDPIQHTITLANAGHLPPLLRRAASGEVESVWSENGGFPLGIEADQEFHPLTVPMEPGDLLLLYSDGLTEAMNPTSDLFGSRRTRDCVVRNGTEPRSLLAGLIKDVEEFRDGQPASDDLCLVSLKRKAVA